MTVTELATTKTLYKNHGKTIGKWTISVVDEDSVQCRLLIQHSKSLDGKPVTSYVTVKGKNIGRANETSPMAQAVKELASRVKKQVDKGYVEDIKDAEHPATNALGLQTPMLADRWDKRKGKLCYEELLGAYVQPKLDGNRTLMQGGVAWTRTGQKHKNVQHILDEIEEAGLSEYGFDGELYIHGKRLQDINSLIKRFQPETLDLEFHVYDLFDQGSADFNERVTKLMALLPSNLPHVKFVPTYRLESPKTLEEALKKVEDMHDDFVMGGYEGAIVRLNGFAYAGKRHKSLLKVKQFQDAEFEIVGCEERQPIVFSPEGEDTILTLPEYRTLLRKEGDKYLLRQGVWNCVSQEGVKFNVGIQGTMWESAKLLEEALNGDHIGSMLTVRFFYYSADGVPQLPCALQFREND